MKKEIRTELICIDTKVGDKMYKQLVQDIMNDPEKTVLSMQYSHASTFVGEEFPNTPHFKCFTTPTALVKANDNGEPEEVVVSYSHFVFVTWSENVEEEQVAEGSEEETSNDGE